MLNSKNVENLSISLNVLNLNNNMFNKSNLTKALIQILYFEQTNWYVFKSVFKIQYVISQIVYNIRLNSI